jgi:hypothetical protein
MGVGVAISAPPFERLTYVKRFTPQQPISSGERWDPRREDCASTLDGLAQLGHPQYREGGVSALVSFVAPGSG